MLKCRTAFNFNGSTQHFQVWEWNTTVLSQIRRATQLALQAEHSTGKPQTALLLELDATASQLIARAEDTQRGAHWSDHMHSNNLACGSCPASFLAYAISNGLTLFVESQLADSAMEKGKIEGKSPLLYAIWDCPLSARTVLAYPAMVAMLLRAGFDPNETSDGSTPWQSLLDFIRSKQTNCSASALSATFNSAWLDTCKLFVLYGADVRIDEREGVRGPLVWETLEPAFRHLPPGPVLELKKMILDRENRLDSADSQSFRAWRQMHHKNRSFSQRSHQPRRRRYRFDKGMANAKCYAIKHEDYEQRRSKVPRSGRYYRQNDLHLEPDRYQYHACQRDYDDRLRFHDPFPMTLSAHEPYYGSRDEEPRKYYDPWEFRQDPGYPPRWRPY